MSGRKRPSGLGSNSRRFASITNPDGTATSVPAARDACTYVCIEEGGEWPRAATAVLLYDAVWMAEGKTFRIKEMRPGRGMGSTTSVIRHGPLVYDQAGRVATIDGRMVELSARELGLLEVLLQRAGRLVSKEQLVDRLCEWGEEVSNNAIEVYIHRLRKKIESGPIRIATVRGLGYCLEKVAPDRVVA